MQASMKLIDLVEKNVDEIAKQWAKDVKKNSRTPHYHDLPEEEIVAQAIQFYRRLRDLMMVEYVELAREYSADYAREQYEKGIPLHEALYALVLMRRRMWLYAEIQAAFVSVLEQQQAIESLSRTILMSDHIVYMVTNEYHRLIRHDMEKRLGRR